MKKPKLSSTMQIAVTASALNQNAKAVQDKQAKAEKDVRRLPMPAHLAVRM